jgi:iron uptake system component EfeO
VRIAKHRLPGGERWVRSSPGGAVYAEVEAFGPGTTSPMRLDAGSGSYAFRCLFEDFDPLTGPTVEVGGQVRGSPFGGGAGAWVA